MGRCGTAPHTLTLFKTNIADFPTLFKTEFRFFNNLFKTFNLNINILFQTKIRWILLPCSSLRLRPHASGYFLICNFFLFRIQTFPRPSTRYLIRCGFIIFHSGERTQKYPDLRDECGRKPYAERENCGFRQK